MRGRSGTVSFQLNPPENSANATKGRSKGQTAVQFHPTLIRNRHPQLDYDTAIREENASGDARASNQDQVAKLLASQ